MGLIPEVPPTSYVRWTLRLLACRVAELEIVESISHDTIFKGELKADIAKPDAKFGEARTDVAKQHTG